MLDFIASDVGKVVAGALIAFTGQIVVAVIAWAKEASTKKAVQRKEAEFLAFQLVVALERMVGEAYNAIHDPLIYLDEGEANPTVANPKLNLPHGGDYKTLPAQLMYRVLSFPNRIIGMAEGMSAVAEHSGPPNYEEVFLYRREECAKLGLDGLAIIDDLCRKYAIPAPTRPKHYDPKEAFERDLKKVQEENNKLAEQRRRAWEMILTGHKAAGATQEKPSQGA